MNRKLEFFYDYVSLYSYLANSQLDDLDAEIVYRPMFLGAVLQATGNNPPLTIKAKGTYLFKDVSRWADRYKIPYKMNPKFPQNTVNALRLALIAQEKGVFHAVHQPLFDAMWARERDLSDSSLLSEIAAGAGLPAAETLSEIGSDRIKDRLRENTDEAIQRGAFGAPTLFVGEEMFFGNDRFEFVKQALTA
ncbi:MAG: 2-hydroxychromene-2-carboxylate isomerase [Woeseiaceae bacterium]